MYHGIDGMNRDINYIYKLNVNSKIEKHKPNEKFTRMNITRADLTWKKKKINELHCR